MRIGPFDGSALLYLAVEGGFDIAPVLDSQSTYVRGEIGGWRGRPLRAGDRVPLRRNEAMQRTELEIELDFLAPRSRLRAIEGAQADYFSADQIDAFHAGQYRVSAQWSRMGVRLEGPPIRHARGFNIVSDALVRGSIQIPGNGQPIVLMNEHQTTGGYPKIATVITADLPALGRLAPGAAVSFAKVSRREAEAARREMATLIEQMPSRVREKRQGFDGAPSRLFEANLISGVVDAGATIW